jgi:hypothetical protein
MTVLPAGDVFLTVTIVGITFLAEIAILFVIGLI